MDAAAGSERMARLALDPRLPQEVWHLYIYIICPRPDKKTDETRKIRGKNERK